MRPILDTMSQMRASWTHLVCRELQFPYGPIGWVTNAMSHVTSTLFSQPPPSTIPHPALIPPPSSTPRSLFCGPRLTYPTLAGKMGMTLTTPTQHPQSMSPFGPFYLCSPLTTVLRTQEWPEHHSHKERVLKPGATPSTTQWQEMEAPIPIFGMSPTSFRPHYHSFPVTSCATRRTLAFTAQRHYVGPQTSVYDPTTTF